MKYPFHGLSIAPVLCLFALVSPLSYAQPSRPKIDLGHVPGLFGDRSYASAEEILTEIKSLAHPWNHIFFAPPKGDAAVPEGYDWEFAEVVADLPEFACVAASLSAHYLHVGNHAAILLQRGEDRRFRVADVIVRRLGGYTSFTPSLIRPFEKEPPSLIIRTYEGGRRSGESHYEIFRPVRIDDLLQWQPTLEIPTQYDQSDVTEELEFFSDGEGNLQVKVTREWIQADRPQEVTSHRLSWDAATRTFPIDPLRGKLALLAAEIPIRPAVPVDVDGAQPVPELDIMEVGMIANLKIGSTGDDVRKAVEGKLFKGEDVVWEAIGEAVQEWIFPDSGLSFQMSSEKPGGAKTVFAITMKAPSKALTGRGIGIGSARADVLRVYSDFESEGDDGFFGEEDVYLVGSIYGGMIFTFKEDKVSEIFLGAAAE